MAACKLEFVIPEDHRVEIRLPADLPPGPAVMTVESRSDVTDLGARRRAARGMDAGKGRIAEDFDAPLPENLLRLFEGGD